MKVINIKEMEDGSAMLTIELEEEEENLLIEKAINDILRDHLDKEKNDKRKISSKTK